VVPAFSARQPLSHSGHRVKIIAFCVRRAMVIESGIARYSDVNGRLGPTLPWLLIHRYRSYPGDDLPNIIAWTRLSSAGDRPTVPGGSSSLVLPGRQADVNRARSNPRSNGEFGAVNQRLQLGPGDLGMAAAAEAAISAGHHILQPQETPEAADALSH
jgi:hypothetical protein